MFEHRRKLFACAMLVFGCHAAYRIPEPADKTGGTVGLSGALAFPGAGCGAVAALSAVGTGRIDREPEFGYDHGAGIGRAPRGETALSQITRLIVTLQSPVPVSGRRPPLTPWPKLQEPHVGQVLHNVKVETTKNAQRKHHAHRVLMQPLVRGPRLVAGMLGSSRQLANTCWCDAVRTSAKF